MDKMNEGFCLIKDCVFQEKVADAAVVTTLGKTIGAQKLPACHPNTYNITVLSVT